jgi:hypothetical protein
MDKALLPSAIRAGKLAAIVVWRPVGRNLSAATTRYLPNTSPHARSEDLLRSKCTNRIQFGLFGLLFSALNLAKFALNTPTHLKIATKAHQLWIGIAVAKPHWSTSH